jgi:phage-related protein
VVYEIEFYTTELGRSPMEEYLNSLPVKLRAKTFRSLKLLQEFGPMLREPNTKPLGDGLFELRTMVGSDAGRSIFFFFDKQKIVITNGFLKKTRKTPLQEIETARRYRLDYLQQQQR